MQVKNRVKDAGYGRRAAAMALAGLGLGALFFAAPQAARAQLNLTLTPSDLNPVAGETIVFYGVLTNPTSATVFLTGDAFGLTTPPAGFTEDDTAFVFNAPSSLAPSASYGDGSTIEFFRVTIAPGTAAGAALTDRFDVLGGNSSTSQNLVGSAPFSVRVSQATTTAPEPSSLAIFALGMVSTGGVIRRRRRA